MPICPKCDSTDVDFYRSRWTKRPVYRDAKVMAKCRRCANVFIVFDQYLETSTGVSPRKRWWRVIAYAAGSAFGFADFWFDVFSYGFSDKIALIIAIVCGSLGIVEIVLFRTLAQGRRPAWWDSESTQMAFFYVTAFLMIAAGAIIGKCFTSH